MLSPIITLSSIINISFDTNEGISNANISVTNLILAGANGISVECEKESSYDINFMPEETIEKELAIDVIKLTDYLNKNEVHIIRLIKIDTEGFEYNILRGIKEIDYEKIRYIYFEHHYDLMIEKGYTFSNINSLLVKNNFKKIFKIKMKFRKSFEYIYEKKV